MLGLGYVGSTTAARLLKDGHEVVGIDVSPDKLDSIGRGKSPVVEPGVDELLAEGFAAGRLQAGPRLDPWLDQLDLAMVCVGTPSRADGKLELTHLLEVSRQLATFLRGLIPQGADQVFQAGSVQDQGYEGVPVRRVSTIAGQQMVTELTSVARQTFPDSAFEVPAGFTKRNNPLAGRGRGRR